jgi:hypothetical protein
MGTIVGSKIGGRALVAGDESGELDMGLVYRNMNGAAKTSPSK